MIHQGRDELSRGDTNGLVTSGVSLSSMVQLHLSATERAPYLFELIQDWVAIPDLHIIIPEGWFTYDHFPGAFPWFPVLVAVDASIDQFCEALHKRGGYGRKVLVLGVPV
jgi:hypothetical protein